MTDTPLTLTDYAAEPNFLVAGVAKTLQEESPFMDKLTFVDAGTISVKTIHEGKMADVSWRRIGAPHGSVVNTKPEEITENVFSIGNSIVLDKMYMKDQSKRLYDPMTYQTRLTTKSIARNFCDKAINGLPSDVDNPVGLWYRVKNDLAASQNILAKTSGLDISPDATGLAANSQAFIDKLDELLYAVTGNFNGGQGLYFLCNSTAMMRVNSIFRQSGLTDSTQDTLGRIFKEYKGAQFIDMGTKYDDITPIISDVELADGTAVTGGASTSIYCVKIGAEYFTAWQEYALDVSDPEVESDKVTWKSVIDWTVGLAISHPKAVARLYGIIAK